jgi:hypothetical protein|tara:strand:+ start:10815 stop:11630 length:816 start_codon:yes stop_codon:yes gene_type:complete
MKFTYYTIIGKDLSLLQGHMNNVKSYAGFDKLTCEKELIVIVYKNNKIPEKITQSILDYCNDNNIRTEIYDEPTDVFIENLYACWNLGYEISDDGYVFRGGSDQVFSRDSFVSLYEEAEKLRKLNKSKFILQANTIENATRLRQIGAISRHFALDLGATFHEFNYGGFEDFCNRMNTGVIQNILTIDDCLKYWGKPTKLNTSLGNIDRTDGCSWLMTKQDWLDHGPLPHIENWITGDVVIHDRMQTAGYENYLVRDCITYHFVRGESIDVQ